MKFLYFKDADVFGPLEVNEIAKESCFSAEILVCPVDKAEDQSSWKFAKEYPEFKDFLPQTNISNEKSKQETQNVTAQDLPALEDTATESSSEFNKENFFANEIGGDKNSSQNQDFTMELVNIPQGHTFHVDHKQDNMENKKAVITADISQEDISNGNISTQNKDKTSENTLTMKNLEDMIAGKDNFLEISNNKIISSSDGRVKKTKKNDLIFILSFVVITVVAIAICFAFLNMNRNQKESNKEATSGQNITETNSSQDLSPAQEIVSEVMEDNKFPAQEKEITYEDQAIDIVKNTIIKSKGKTIDNYLKELYEPDYKCSWSAKPFTSKTYIVEFFASQVRSEPLVYLFRVDIDEKEITGALNNITLDLLA